MAWRLLDTGHLSAAQNCALDRAILKARSEGKSPSTVRFLQFRPACVLVGFHQALAQEVRLDFCRDNRIDINRRITGGGAIFFGEEHLGWEIFARPTDLDIPPNYNSLTRKICECVALALRDLGVPAAFRPRNDIEVQGKKISGTGGTELDGAFMFQGTLLTVLDIETMLRALRIPIKKLSDKEIKSTRERVTSLENELGFLPDLEVIKRAIASRFERQLHIDLVPGSLSQKEVGLMEKHLPLFESKNWIQGTRELDSSTSCFFSLQKFQGGVVRVALSLDTTRNIINTVRVTGDFFAFPARAILDLEAFFKKTGASREEVISRVIEFYENTGTSVPGVSPEDFAESILAAVAKKTLSERLGLTHDESNYVYLVNSPLEKFLEEGFDTLLVPYCSKELGCEYRQLDACIKCGECSASDAYSLGEELGLNTITIVNYEHLESVLSGLGANGSPGFIGCCCEPFLVKHFEDFERAKIPGLLIDMESESCYDLGLEDRAYKGEYENQTELKIDILEKILAQRTKSLSPRKLHSSS